MNLLFKLLLIVIASAGASGYYARAPQSESNSRPPMWAPRLAQASALMLTALPAPEPHPPVYIASFPAGVENGLVFGSAASLLLGGDAAPEMMDASALVAAGPSDYHQAGPLPPSDESVPATVIAAAYSVRVPAAAGGSADLSIPVSTQSEPSGWTLLLSSFLVVGFIARRRSRLVSG